MSYEKKQKLIEYRKKHSEVKNDRKMYMYHNMTDEQRRKVNDYQKEYRKNMTEEQKQRARDCQREYHRKCYAAKKLENKTTTNA